MALSVSEGRKISWADRDKAGALGRLSAYDFLDRVINIKFYFKSANGLVEEAVLRSDYEAYDSDAWKAVLVGRNPSYSAVRKCVVKPGIKVQYKQTGGSVATEVDVFIDNFFALSGGSDMLMQFSAGSMTLDMMEIQIGYFGQFASLYALQSGGVPTLSQLYDMKAPGGSYVIRCNVQYVVTEKLPPDAVLKIHAYVGSTFNMSVDEGKYDKPYDESTDMAKSGGTRYDSIPQWVFENVTRRYRKQGVEKLAGIVKGRMPAVLAKKKGVNVWYSQGVAESYYLTGRRVRLAADGTKVSSPFFETLTWGGSVLKTLSVLRNTVSNQLRIHPLTDGSWLMVTADEFAHPEKFGDIDWYEYNSSLPQTQPTNDGGKISPASVGLKKVVGGYGAIDEQVQNGSSAAQAVKALLSKANTHELPAVYNITQDALCTITCPFSTFLTNFSKVSFSARYTRSSLVTYYAGGGKPPQEFTVLWQNVSFATVEDVNEVLLTCKAAG